MPVGSISISMAVARVTLESKGLNMSGQGNNKGFEAENKYINKLIYK